MSTEIPEEVPTAVLVESSNPDESVETVVKALKLLTFDDLKHDPTLKALLLKAQAAEGPTFSVTPPKVADASIPQHKVVLLGDAKVGKTSFLSALAPFHTYYVPMSGAKVSSVLIEGKEGQEHIFHIWEALGAQTTAHALNGAHAGLIMFDVMSRMSYRGIPQLYKDYVQHVANNNIVLIGNKCDSANRKVKPKSITFHRKKNCQYYDVSALQGYNIQKPLLYLQEKLTTLAATAPAGAY
jgi:GTP-binding nuclear protein Ran